ncbi:hypothetical protein CR513_34315, partial [Mucuna pruriens]
MDGYTHLHYGAIRLILTLHGRRGLPVSARISLLDTSYLHYENAVIGTVLTTLHAGSVVLTIFPNYNVNLRDPTITHKLKVQVQITRADQVAKALSATLHHQIIYRLQDHAINLALPTCNDGALYVMANNQEESPSIIQVLRNISQEQLRELVPLKWVTNYEKLHYDKKPIRSMEATYRRSVDGTVKTVFRKPDEVEPSSSSIFQSLMIRPYVKEGKIPIWGVRPNGESIYTDKVNGHFIWDVDPSMCDSDCDCCYDDPNDEDPEGEEDSSEDEDEWPCKPPLPPRRDRNPKEKPWVGIRQQKKPNPDWIYKRGLQILQERNLLPTPCIKKNFFPVMGKNSSPVPCMMFIETDFPSLERKVDVTTKVTTKPHITSSEVGTDERPKPLSQAEEVLNWQTDNARAQNLLLKKIDEKVDKISFKVDKCDERLEVLSDRMRKLYHQLTAEISKNEEEWRKLKFGEESNRKEREVCRLKAELYELENYIERKAKERQEERESSLRGSSSYMTSSIHVSPMFLPPPPSFFTPPPKQWTLPTATPFKESRRPESSTRTSARHDRKSSPEPSHEDVPTPHPKSSIFGKDVFQDSQDPYSQFTVKIYDAETSPSNSSSDTEDSQSASYPENTGIQEEYDSKEIASEETDTEDLEKDHDYAILMANTTQHTEAIYDDDDEVTSPPQHNTSKPNSGPWFTLDDVPPRYWRRRLIEFGAWLDTKLMKDPDSYKVIEEFCCRMTGTLKEWYHHLGAVRQNQLHEQGSSAAILGILHEEFIGDGGSIDKKIRQEYYSMKCCSIKIKDLDDHFQRMLRRF